MYLYIAYRNLKDHYAQNNLCGGPSYNNDYRFTAICDGVYYLLTKDNMNYAVSKENGDKFIEEVKSKCTGEHPDFFPLVPSLNGKETAAVVEMSQGRNQFYYDMDDELLLQMLDDLKAKSGEPLNERELMTTAILIRLFLRGILNCARSITAFTLSLITLRLPLSGHSIRIRHWDF